MITLVRGVDLKVSASCIRNLERIGPSICLNEGRIGTKDGTTPLMTSVEVDGFPSPMVCLPLSDCVSLFFALVESHLACCAFSGFAGILLSASLLYTPTRFGRGWDQKDDVF